MIRPLWHTPDKYWAAEYPDADAVEAVLDGVWDSA